MTAVMLRARGPSRPGGPPRAGGPRRRGRAGCARRRCPGGRPGRRRPRRRARRGGGAPPAACAARPPQAAPFVAEETLIATARAARSRAREATCATGTSVPRYRIAAAGRGQDEGRHLQAEAVGLAGQRREDDEGPGGPLLERHPQRAQQVPDALREEVLVADLQVVLLPALADRADERADARLEELDRAHARPVRQELAREALPVERLHEAQEARHVLGRGAARPRPATASARGGAALEQPSRATPRRRPRPGRRGGRG